MGEGLERETSRSQGTGPPTASGCLGRVHASHCPSAQWSAGPPPRPTQPPAGTTKVLNCDMNRSLASYPAPGPHSLDLDMPVMGAHLGFPKSSSINSFHTISPSLVSWSKDAHWGREVRQLRAGGGHWRSRWLLSGSAGKQYNSVCPQADSPASPCLHGKTGQGC